MLGIVKVDLTGRGFEKILDDISFTNRSVLQIRDRNLRFTRITLPMISPSIFLALILTLIGSLKVFGQIYVMTGGGPGTSTYVLVFYIFQQAFRLYEFGYASAIAFILFFIVLLLTLAQWWMRKKWVFHEQ